MIAIPTHYFQSRFHSLQVPQVVVNLQLAAMADLFPASDARELLQSTVDAVRNEALPEVSPL